MDECTTHPFLAKPVTGANGAVATLRALKSTDSDSFGEFLETLSTETRETYNPHPLDRTEAQRICAALDDPTALRFVLADARDDRVVAYLLAQSAIPQSEKERYRKLGWTIEDGTDCDGLHEGASGDSSSGCQRDGPSDLLFVTVRV
ncbi:hypothetical protein [Streptomyces sp. NPDC057287]|uniref:hypothetical protein n=1 Tax=Streptomyces sp. NPDC057287 TaxID=3346086 RepID=UPI003634A558